MTRFSVFFSNLQKDLRTFFFLLLLICAFRGYFIFYMQSYLSQDAGAYDIALAMWAGFRISLKSAGIFALFSFLVCTLSNVIFPRLSTERMRCYLCLFYIFVLAVLFQARFPYYEEFHVTFNHNIFNTFKDDLQAIAVTIVQEYQLPLRFLAAVFLTVLLYKLYCRVMRSATFEPPRFSSNLKSYCFRTAVVLFIPTFMVFIRFGGSFNYTHSINWENAGITKDVFLNETILDDLQAMYRAYITNKKMADGKITGVHRENILSYAQALSERSIQSNRLDEYLAREAGGAKLPKPKRIFIILGESYAQWPMLESYSDLHVADGIRNLVRQENAAFVRAFMPNGAFTSMAFTGMVTGLSDVNIYPNYQPETYKSPYVTALAPQMKRLGYKTSFWYGGFPSWERIEEFSLAQGFDEFHSCADFGGAAENIWGTKDGNLFNALGENIAEEEPTVYLVLTLTNHPPYNLNLQAEGFDAASVAAALPESEKNNRDIVNELGHYWYMDKVIGEFVAETYRKYPNSLFIITGDHADRMNLSNTPTIFERFSIPLVFYGHGVTSDIFPREVAGSHTNILPTLIELIAPKGFKYYSIADSLTKGNVVGFNRDIWVTPHGIGEIDGSRQEILPGASAENLDEEKRRVMEKIEMMRTISWWLMEKGNYIDTSGDGADAKE